VAEAARVATSRVTYVEARVALARRRQAAHLDAASHRAILRELEANWERWIRLDVTEALVRDAARLAETYGLRAYDAVHLASALVFAARHGGDVAFASWHDRLDAAATREGLKLLRRRR